MCHDLLASLDTRMTLGWVGEVDIIVVDILGRQLGPFNSDHTLDVW